MHCKTINCWAVKKLKIKNAIFLIYILSLFSSTYSGVDHSMVNFRVHRMITLPVLGLNLAFISKLLSALNDHTVELSKPHMCIQVIFWRYSDRIYRRPNHPYQRIIRAGLSMGSRSSASGHEILKNPEGTFFSKEIHYILSLIFFTSLEN